ncbi:unnamed protein product, partial [Allacma fusca]
RTILIARVPIEKEALEGWLSAIWEKLPKGRVGKAQNQDDMEKATSSVVQQEVTAYAKSKGRTVISIKIPMPKVMPNLSSVRAACPRKAAFSFFYPPHQDAMYELFQVFMKPETVEDFIATVAYCRDSDMMNPRLFLYAYSKACLTRKDTRGFQFPSLYEVMPDVFVNTVVVRQAEEYSGMPMEARKVLTANGPSMMAQAMANPDGDLNPDVESPAQERQIFNRSYTGRDFNPENKLAYFREDMGVNSHHHHWHVVYAPKEKLDRKGELFYYMHHNLVARYDAERLSNGLPRVIPLDITTRPIIAEAYFSKLTAENSKMAYAGRQANTPVADIDIPPDPDAGMPDLDRVNIEDMRKSKDRILEAIDSGFFIKREELEDGRLKLTQVPAFPDGTSSVTDPGVDILGNLMESNDFSINQKFYGDLHNDGHRIMSRVHDPRGHFKESYGAVGDLPTAMRDPAFYRWHKFIDEMFEYYKRQMKPYTEAQLIWEPIQVENISVQIKGNAAPAPNILKTYWMQSDIDLGRGLDIRRSLSREGAIWARITHLNHEEFQYKINVINNSTTPVRGTFRIFMAPRDNEHGQRLYYIQQRLLFFEMDKFVHTVPPGRQEVVRESTESAITIPWEQSFKDLEDQLQDGPKEIPHIAVCGCGWPQHMLVPRGLPQGMFFDLFVMVTNAEEDIPEGSEPNPDVKCKESISFCGILNKKYPDLKPMGFPFDREPSKIKSNQADMMDKDPQHLSGFIGNKPNMKAVEIKIIHETRKVKLRGNGAPPEMPVREPELATSKRTKNRPNRNGRESPDYFD